MSTMPLSLPNLTVGLDLGDRFSQVWAVDAAGHALHRARLRTTPAALEQHFAGSPRPS